MIISVGIDIIEINEIKNSMEKSKRFVERVFTENEKHYCESKENKFQHFAARFAAKEAAMKALGTGWDNGVQWKQIEVVNDIGELLGNQHSINDIEEVTPDAKSQMPNTKCLMPNAQSPMPNKNKPEIMLNGKARAIAKELNVDKIHISLSHSLLNATAMVILEGFTDSEIRF